jgi:thiaminase/transcriptional activator TenA
MKFTGYTAEIRGRTDALWRRILEHPFVAAIGAGALDRERFQFYLKQDYLYLIEFSRVLALATAKGETLEDMRFFSGLLSSTLGGEMELHRRTCADFGIPSAALEETEPTAVTTAYTGALLAACYQGSLADITAVLLPCAAGYVEIAQSLRARGLPEDRHCRDWIETYSSSEMVEMAAWLARRLERFADGAAEGDRDRWLGLYRTSARFELLFFEMAWEGSTWPGEGVEAGGV